MIAVAPDVRSVAERASERIAPTWPLDRFIAVNPLWGWRDERVPSVAARLASWSGTRLLMPRAWYRAAWRSGEIRPCDLRRALARGSSLRSEAQLVALLDTDTPTPCPRARVVDVLDAPPDPTRPQAWRDYVVQDISAFCAAWFDEGQAKVPPARDDGLYRAWWRRAAADRGPALRMGLDAWRALVRDLPDDPGQVLQTGFDALEIPAAEREAYATSLLLDVNGWAAWCAYRRWMARLDGRDDPVILELLAVRLAWEWLLYRSAGPGFPSRWRMAVATWAAADRRATREQADDWVWQAAAEFAYARHLEALLATPVASSPDAPEIHAVFCIDVRSEGLRRALEVQTPRVATLGFAGFFGLPISYTPVGTSVEIPQLPGLLVPRLRAEAEDAVVAVRRTRRLDAHATWAHLRGSAGSGFSFVEAFGPLYAARLLTDALGWTRPSQGTDRAGLTTAERARGRPRLADVPLEARQDLAAALLRGMSLTRGFGRLVLLVGHGSSSTNNPHASGLDCGACCGRSGEVNARLAADLLNDPDVRRGLAQRGLDVPDHTWFLSGLHDTTTDEVTLFDLDVLPLDHASDVQALTGWLTAASATIRAERSARLGLGGMSATALRDAVRARARDWAQVRPEWGLANQAAFLVAPRARTRGLDFGGRVFLHEYLWTGDPDFTTLDQILTAPLVVAQWINLQYYASTVDNLRYGSGNKALHNVVGGRIGVFEGNGGDLRIGLPLQSLHDGERWVHTPLRLHVVVDAPRDAIVRVLDRRETVRHLVENEWIHLSRFADHGGIECFQRGEWTR